MKAIVKKLLPENYKAVIITGLDAVRRISIKKAVEQQGFANLCRHLKRIVPDLTDQYSTFKVDTKYLRAKVRGQHAFQISLVQKACGLLAGRPADNLTIVDIGDSSGTHLKYIQQLIGSRRVVGVNCDPHAVERIRRSGLEAVHAKAEDLNNYNINADIFLSFEMLEHLSDPVSFLYSLAENTDCDFFVVTVPYLKRSRVGLHHIRNQCPENRYAENTHYFELCPEDWRLLMMHAGWQIVDEKIYFQYPGRGVFSLMKYVWRKTDFEGFYGVILKRDDQWSKKYIDW